MIRAYGPLLEPLGLTYPQYIVMLALWAEGEPMTVGGLGHRLGLDSGTLTPLLKRLEPPGLGDRRRAPTDDRRVLVSLTSSGEGLRQAAADIPACLQERLQLDVDKMVVLHGTLLEFT